MDKDNDRKEARTLFYIPIIHTKVDMGLLGEPIRQATIRKKGESGLKEKEKSIENFWMETEKVVGDLKIQGKTTRLYQDGLPVCGKETEIIKDLVKAGSRNHRLLLDLVEKGSVLMGTESAELLVEEYNFIKKMLSMGDSSEAVRFYKNQKSFSASLIKRRDRFIAERINHTLGDGEAGILFIGMLHSLENLLARDIQVIYPTIKQKT